ncbi:unnamed protein product [Umbelopsis ramanniana]
MPQYTRRKLGSLIGITPLTGGRELEIWTDKAVTIGSGETCDLQVSDPIVSAVHSRFYTKEIQGDDWLIYCEDLSKNGTFFNKRRMGKNQNIILLDGCTIHLNSELGYTFVQSYPPTSHTEKMYPVNLDNEYKLTEKRLGYGSQTKIVLAAAIDHDTKQFACKIINIKSLVKELAEKVKIQLAIIRHVQHPCILKAIKVNLLSEDNAFVIMPIYQGGTLQDFVLQRQRLPENEARFIFYQLIRGIIYLHGQQIIHRDLKPENIFLARDKQFPRIVIADFGLAAWMTETSSLSEDVGTLAYSAPELVAGKPYDAQIDDWSVGAILYFLLTSRHAFALEGAEDEDTQKLVLSGKYDTTNPLWPEVSNEAKKLVAELLVVDPQSRVRAGSCLQSEWIMKDLDMLERIYLATESEVP